MKNAQLTNVGLKTLAPQFLVLNLEESIAFYTQKLGFSVDFIYENFYASVVRDGVTLHLKLSDEAEPGRDFRKQGEHLDVYFATDDVNALFEEYSVEGVTFTKPLQATPWGTTEFVLEDRDGYILCFGQPGNG